MKRYVFCFLLIVIGFGTVVSNVWGEPGETSRSYMYNYSFTPDGATGPYSDYQEAFDVDSLGAFLPPPPPADQGGVSYTFYARGVTSQSDYRSEVGSGASFSEMGAVDVDYVEVRSCVENTQRFYLSDDDGDGFDDIDIGINTFMYGNVGLYNPYFTPLPLNVTFGEEGYIEVGYRLSVTAASDHDYFWNSFLGIGGVWEHEFAMSEGVLYFDESGTTIGQEILLDDLMSESFGPLLNIDVGKPFDVTVSLETWLVGQDFNTTGNSDDRLTVSSSLHGVYPPPYTNLCYAEVVSGGTPSAVPEPSTIGMLFALVMFGVWVRRRK